MNNTARANRKANTEVKGSRNTKAKNSLTQSRTFIAAVSAAVAAITMAAGIAVTAAIVAPADNKITQTPMTAATAMAPKADNAAESAEKPAKAKTTAKTVEADKTVTESSEAKQTTTTAAPAEQKAETPITQAAPAEQKTEAPVTQAAPAEQKAEAPVTQAAPAEQKAETPAPVKSGTPVIPQGEINDWKTHDAKDGFPIGSYYGSKDAKQILNVVKLDNTNYKITVTSPTSDTTADVYTINAIADGSKMYYSSAAKTAVVYDAAHNVIESKAAEGAHKGTFDASDAGYTWADTEGTTIFVPWIGYR